MRPVDKFASPIRMLRIANLTKEMPREAAVVTLRRAR